jgi:hypothetical protein
MNSSQQPVASESDIESIAFLEQKSVYSMNGAKTDFRRAFFSDSLTADTRKDLPSVVLEAGKMEQSWA